MLWVGIIILSGIGLRMIGIDHGLPGIYHPDEPIVVSRAADLVINGKWNPKFFHWPSFLIYLLALEYEIVYAIGFLLGKFKSSEEFFKFYLLDRGIFHLIGRITVALMSVGIGYFIFLTLKIIKSNRAGIIGILFAEFTLLLVKHGQYVTPDVPAAFFSTVSIYFFTRFYFLNRLDKSLIWSGIFSGLAMASKYNYALLLIPIWIIALSKQDLRLRNKLSNLVWASIMCIFVFLITNPFLILDYPTFSFQFYEISKHLKEGHIGMESKGNASIELLKQLFIKNNPIPLIIFFIGGLFYLLRKSFKFGLGILSFPIILTISHFQWQVTADRYAVPLVPAFLIVISLCLTELIEDYRKWIRFGTHLITAILLIHSFAVSFDHCLENAKLDTREIARKWIEANIPSGSKIAIEKNGPTLAHANNAYHKEGQPSYYYFEIIPWFGISFRGDDPLELIMENRPQYVITNSIVFSRYLSGKKSNADDVQIVYKVWRRYYDALNKYGNLVYEVSPDKKYTGPVVRVYHIPQFN